MKGLLLKDWYALKTYCRATIFIIILFSIVGGVMKGNYVFTLYPCIMAGVTAVSLLAYEEKEKWEQYAATLPYTRAQMVSSKYIIALCLGLATILLNVTVQLIRMIVLGTFDINRLLSMLSLFLPLALLLAAFLLPFIFKLGVNKGRIAYYIVIGVFCGGIVAIAVNDTLGSIVYNVSIPRVSISGIVLVASLLIYALSWALSIRFYKNREF